MAPEALPRRVIAAFLACWCAIGCSHSTDSIAAAWVISPGSPIVGAPAVVRVTLLDAGAAVRGAKLRLEAHMSHPGMTPVTADAIEQAGGSYESRLTLSMAGEWTVVVSGALADGSRIIRSTQVRAVAPATPR
jgi:YtkA-like